MEQLVRNTAFLTYTDRVITYHQYQDALDLTPAEAQTHPDTLEAFGDIHDTVAANPALSSIYLGVLRYCDDRRAAAIERARQIELDIVKGLYDNYILETETFYTVTDELADDAEIYRRAERFIELFKTVMPDMELTNDNASGGQPSPPKETPQSTNHSQKPRKKRAARTPAARSRRDPRPGPKTGKRPSLHNRRPSLRWDFDKTVAGDVDNVDPLDTARKVGGGAATFLLDGFYKGHVTVGQIKQALQAMAGHPLLETDGVGERYHYLQQAVAEHSRDPLQNLPPLVSRSYIENLIVEVPAWHERALCPDTPDVNFYPKRGESTKPAKAVCAECAAIDDCLGFALTTGNKFGIWGGLSERQRRVLRRVRSAGEASAAEIQALINTMRGDTTPDQDDPLDEFDDVFEE